MKMKKSILSVLLAAMLTLGLVSPAFAATPKITGVKKAIDYLASYNFSDVIFQDLSSKEYVYPLSAGMFEWSDSATYSDSAPVTQAQFSNAAITLRVANMPTTVFEYIRLEYRTSSKTGGVKSMCVVVKFQDEYVSTKDTDFNVTVQLLRSKTRMTESTLQLQGTLSNRVKTLATNQDYVSIAKGEVLSPAGTIRNVEIELGYGVFITAPYVYSNRLYYGVASLDVSSADDPVLNKHGRYIEDIITLKTIGFSSLGGKPVKLEGYSGLYIYDADGKYLGTGNSTLPYSNRYYCTNRQVDFSGIKLSGGTSSSTSSSTSSTSSTSSSSSSTSSATGTTTTTSGKAYDSTSIASLASSAVTTAKNSRLATATVKVRDAQSITVGGLQAISRAAANAGLSSSFVADTVKDNRVVGRLTITPKRAADLTSTATIKLGVYVDAASIKTTKNRFDAWYKNNMVYVAMDHQGNFGMTVDVAAYVDVSKLNTSKLRFYCYVPSTNQYREVTTSYRVDSNGYLHFSTSLGGDYIITDAALTKK